MRLRSKILLWFLPLLVAAFLLTGWFAVGTQYISNRNALNTEFNSILRETVDRVQLQLEKADLALGLFSSDPQVIDAVRGEDTSALHDRLLKFNSLKPESNISVLSLDGKVLAGEPTATLLSASLKAGEPLFQDGIDDHVLIKQARAIQAIDEHQAHGYILLENHFDLLSDALRDHPLLSEGQVLIFDRQGQLYSGKAQNQLTQGLILRGLQALRQDESLIEAHVSGNNYWICVAALSDDMYAIAAVPNSVAYEQLVSDSLSILLACMICCALAAWVLYYKLNQLVIQPIERMRDASLAMAAGQMDYRVEHDRKDEVGELERSFENMSMSLQTFSMEMQSLAYQDKLTGLPNRRRFQESLRDAVAHAARHDEKLALLFIDLDGFKQVNDTFGHDMGDRLLEQVARRLKSCLRETDQLAVAVSERELLADVLAQTGDMLEESKPDERHSLARLGGDEFTILLNRLEAGIDAALVAERVLRAFDAPCKVGSQSFHIGASIGIACYPDDGYSADELTKHADTAMYEAKTTGKHRYQFFDAAMGEANARRMELTTELRRSLEERHFELYYQPLVSALSGQVYGCEALLRWKHPEKGTISPAEFIPVAEESGLILPLGEWVINQACHQMRQWHDDGLDRCVISVNISNIQVNRGQLCDLIRDALQSSGLDPRFLLIELTESAIMDASEEVVAELHAIRALGVRVAIDDFGTGYSSLGALKQLPIDVLKIDRSFIDGLARDDKSDAIVAAILAMGNKLGLKLVAEGIESEEQMHLLSLNGCDIYQGYAISHPLPADQLRAFVRDGYELQV